MALSPWPTTPSALADATATLKAAIANSKEDDAPIQRVGSVAAERVEREASDAPQAIKDESVIRFAGYLFASDFGGILREELGPQRIEYVTNHSAAFRNSGAAGLLSPWKIRRAGVIA